jgi:hypothetical protein
MGYPVTTVDAMVTVAVPPGVPGPGFAVAPALLLAGLGWAVAERRRARRRRREGRRGRRREGRDAVGESLGTGTTP